MIRKLTVCSQTSTGNLSAGKADSLPLCLLHHWNAAARQYMKCGYA